MKTPEAYQKREENIGTTSRIVFEQKPDEVVFAGEYLRDLGVLKCYFPVGETFKSFKRLIEGENIALNWGDSKGVQQGISNECNFWYDPMGKLAGFQVDVMSRSVDVASFLDRAVRITLGTVRKKANLPTNLPHELKQFVATPLAFSK